MNETTTVRDLIKALQKYPMDTAVYAYDEDTGREIAIQSVEYNNPGVGIDVAPFIYLREL